MAHLHLLIGPVGAGKSTYAKQLGREQRAVRLTLDAWMTQLFGDDERPAIGRMEWYLERRERCLAQIWSVTQELLAAGMTVVLEPSLIQKAEREELYRRIDGEGCGLTVHVLDAPREVRRARVLKRNAERGETFSVEVPLPYFDLASDLWEPPDEDERRGRDFRFLPS